MSTEAAPAPCCLRPCSAGRGKARHAASARRLDLHLSPGPKGRNQPATHSARQSQASSVFTFTSSSEMRNKFWLLSYSTKKKKKGKEKKKKRKCGPCPEQPQTEGHCPPAAAPRPPAGLRRPWGRCVWGWPWLSARQALLTRQRPGDCPWSWRVGRRAEAALCAVPPVSWGAACSDPDVQSGGGPLSAARPQCG